MTRIFEWISERDRVIVRDREPASLLPSATGLSLISIAALFWTVFDKYFPINIWTLIVTGVVYCYLGMFLARGSAMTMMRALSYRQGAQDATRILRDHGSR